MNLMEERHTSSFRLALAQMRVVGADRDRNLVRAARMITTGARVGAQVVLLPEALDLGWTSPKARELAGLIPLGTAYKFLRDAAKRDRVYVCAGLTERAGRQVYNSAVLISPEGRLLLHHRKLNELEIGHLAYDQGDRLAVSRTPLGTIGLMICADGSVAGQVVSRSLALMGADVILSPCAWAVKPGYNNARTPYGAMWRRCYGAVARDFRIWIAGCSNVGLINGGPWDGHSCIGRSLVVDPRGRPALIGPFGSRAEALLTIDIKPEPRPARGTGWDRFWENRREAERKSPVQSHKASAGRGTRPTSRIYAC